MAPLKVAHLELPDGVFAKVALVISVGPGMWMPDPNSGTGRKGRVSKPYSTIALHATAVGTSLPSPRTASRGQLDFIGCEIDDERHSCVGYSWIDVTTSGPYEISATLNDVEVPTSLHTVLAPMRRSGDPIKCAWPILMIGNTDTYERRSALLRIGPLDPT